MLGGESKIVCVERLSDRVQIAAAEVEGKTDEGVKLILVELSGLAIMILHLIVAVLFFFFFRFLAWNKFH